MERPRFELHVQTCVADFPAFLLHDFSGYKFGEGYCQTAWNIQNYLSSCLLIREVYDRKSPLAAELPGPSKEPPLVSSQDVFDGKLSLVPDVVRQVREQRVVHILSRLVQIGLHLIRSP